MKTTEITVNAECPGCGEPCPLKLDIPSDRQPGWEWDASTHQRWCRRCYADLLAGRHFKATGWVWKVAHHEGRVRYVDELTDWHASAEAYGHVTVTTVYDPDQVYVPPDSPEEQARQLRQMADAMRSNDAAFADLEIHVGEDTRKALRELADGEADP